MSKLENNKIIEKAIILIQNSKFLDAINILEKYQRKQTRF